MLPKKTQQLQESKCSSRLVTKFVGNNHVIISGNPASHHHAPDSAAVDEFKFRNNLKRQAEHDSGPPARIIRKVAAEFSVGVNQRFTNNAQKKVIQRHRPSAQPPPNPGNQEFVIPEKSRVTFEGGLFYRGEVTDDNGGKAFIRTVNDFLAEEENKDKLIGVHCTHGLNRTGYFVCAYMILVQGLAPRAAINAFNDARAHTMERANYLNHLRSLTPASYDSNLPAHNDQQEVIHDANHSRDRNRREARSFNRHQSDRYAGNWRDRSRDNGNWRNRSRENRNGFLLDGAGDNWRDREVVDDRRYNRDDRRQDRSRDNYRSYGRHVNHQDASRSNGEEACSSSRYEPHHNRYKWSRKTKNDADNS
ncbi:AAEL004437-PA [Aedes aegypti]|uniref:AAEL004437-PA n=1 Tax=Aedes aegypti TaxID=7159 RepID=Q17CT2_AEDAE|nr:AAEL004437-PA [Aedes aegypti]